MNIEAQRVIDRRFEYLVEQRRLIGLGKRGSRVSGIKWQRLSREEAIQVFKQAIESAKLFSKTLLTAFNSAPDEYKLELIQALKLLRWHCVTIAGAMRDYATKETISDLKKDMKALIQVPELSKNLKLLYKLRRLDELDKKIEDADYDSDDEEVWEDIDD